MYLIFLDALLPERIGQKSSGSYKTSSGGNGGRGAANPRTIIRIRNETQA